MRRKEIFEARLQFNSGPGGILHAEAAEVRSHARLHHAHPLGVCLSRGHTKIGPDSWQVRLLYTQQIDSLAASNLHHANLILFRNVGDATQFIRRGHAAANARDHRKCAVFLNIGVHAVVDESRRTVFVVITAPQHIEHVAESRLADFATYAVPVDLQDLLH